MAKIKYARWTPCMRGSSQMLDEASTTPIKRRTMWLNHDSLFAIGQAQLNGVN